jgi:hypothetical protein
MPEGGGRCAHAGKISTSPSGSGAGSHSATDSAGVAPAIKGALRRPDTAPCSRSRRSPAAWWFEYRTVQCTQNMGNINRRAADTRRHLQGVSISRSPVAAGQLDLGPLGTRHTRADQQVCTSRTTCQHGPSAAKDERRIRLRWLSPSAPGPVPVLHPPQKLGVVAVVASLCVSALSGRAVAQQ